MSQIKIILFVLVALHCGFALSYVDCRKDAGCTRGYCCSPCTSGWPWAQGSEWCYTTEGRSQDYNYVKCTHDDECDPMWKCAGPCAAFVTR